MNHLVATPITNRLGIATTVHKKNPKSTSTARVYPAPVIRYQRNAEQIVSDWAHDHAGNDVASWVKNFIQQPFVENISAELVDLDRWDVEGAAEYVEGALLELAHDGTLDKHDSMASVFGTSSDVTEYEKLHAALIDGYYIDPVSAWALLYR